MSIIPIAEKPKGDILAIDPGVTTGFVIGSIAEDEVVLCPWQQYTECNDMWKILEFLQPKILVVEDFEFRRGLDKANLFPVQLIGVIRLWIQQQEESIPDFYLQKARLIHGTGAYFDSRDKLKDLEVWKPGEHFHHSMDAMRHWLHWFYFAGGSRFNNKHQELVLFP